jgi:phospho-N-acetylmuramoyl-pentapeptide-transferase
LDGLAGGVLLIVLSSYAVIAFTLGRYDLAAFIVVVLGSLLAFLWFNIFPARFIMGDTGSMSLGVVLGILAMLTDTVFLLPILGFVLVAESASVIIQLFSKKIFKRRVFKSAPFHHHLEAIGWPEPKVVMRLWVVSGIFALLGMALFVVDRLLV